MTLSRHLRISLLSAAAIGVAISAISISMAVGHNPQYEYVSETGVPVWDELALLAVVNFTFVVAITMVTYWVAVVGWRAFTGLIDWVAAAR